MTRQPDTELVFRDYLADDGARAPDSVLDIVENRIRRLRQRPARRLLVWRLPSMSPSIRVATALAVIVVATTGVLIVSQQRSSGTGVGGPSPSNPTLTPSASSPASLSPSAGPSASTPGSAPATSPGPVACEDDLPGCKGALAAGSHGSSFFGPRLIHYVTPDGWTNSIDTPTIYKLDGPDGSGSILLWADPSIEDQGPASCEPAAKGSGGSVPRAADWVAYITTHPGLVTTPPKAFDFPGNRDESPLALDITMDPAWTQTCPGRTYPDVLLIAHPSDPPAVYGVGPADRLRLVVFDTESYGLRTVLIEVYGPLDDAGFAQTLRVTDPVLKSFVFGCGPAAGYGPCGGYPNPSP